MEKNDRSAMCDGKPIIKDMRKAEQIAKRLRRKCHEPLAPYRCKVCRAST